MTLHVALYSILLCVLPISELRGAIPYAIASGANPIAACVLCVAANALVAPLLYGFLVTLHRLLSKWAAYRSVFDRLVERSRKKLKPQVDRWGYIGIAIFVGIPLPFTGAYTGALGAWILGIPLRRAWLAVAAGVVMAGIIVTLVVVLGVGAFDFFIKRV